MAVQSVGLMGLIAQRYTRRRRKKLSVLEPQCFMDDEIKFNGLTKLIVTKDMSERKNKMIELADAFIAFLVVLERLKKYQK